MTKKWISELCAAPPRSPTEQLVEAISLLLQNDIKLLQYDVNERSIAHRLAIYLERLFPGFDVDCEYNRMGLHPKTLYSLSFEEQPGKSSDGSLVYPDIVVHRRGEATGNFLIVEIKKTTSSIEKDEHDFRKLRAYVDELKYRHALFIKFDAGCASPSVAMTKWVAGADTIGEPDGA